MTACWIYRCMMHCVSWLHFLFDNTHILNVGRLYICHFNFCTRRCLSHCKCIFLPKTNGVPHIRYMSGDYSVRSSLYLQPCHLSNKTRKNKVLNRHSHCQTSFHVPILLFTPLAYFETPFSVATPPLPSQPRPTSCHHAPTSS